MELSAARVVLTGAAGGLGRELALEFARRGCQIVLADLRPGPLAEVAAAVREAGGEGYPKALDLSTADGVEDLAAWIRGLWPEGPHLLVNNAGLLDFIPYEESDAARIGAILAVNLEAPMRLTHALLPSMLDRGGRRVAMVGSILGTLPVPCFTTYAASKAGLRTFAEGLRRELAERGVGVTYVGPRAMRTPINGPEVERMARATGMRMDPPARVAAHILAALEKDRAEVHLGFPERLFAWLDRVAPRLIDRALAGEARRNRAFALEEG